MFIYVILYSIIVSALFPLILSLCLCLSVFIYHTHSRYCRANPATLALTGKLIKAPQSPSNPLFLAYFLSVPFVNLILLVPLSSPAPWPLLIPSLPKARLRTRGFR